MLKLFISDMKPLINLILNQEKSTDCGYFLAIFEKHIVTKKVPRDRFDLIALCNILISPEDVAALNMTEPMSECTICELNRIGLKSGSKDNEASHSFSAEIENSIGNNPSTFEEIKSKHIVIAITGFMQED